MKCPVGTVGVLPHSDPAVIVTTQAGLQVTKSILFDIVGATTAGEVNNDTSTLVVSLYQKPDSTLKVLSGVFSA